MLKWSESTFREQLVPHTLSKVFNDFLSSVRSGIFCKPLECIIRKRSAMPRNADACINWIVSKPRNIPCETITQMCMKKLQTIRCMDNACQCISHDDVIKWKHFPRNWPFVREIHRSPVNFPHKGQWRGALMFSLIYAWINDWVNNREAGDLRRQHGHYDVIVMVWVIDLVITLPWKSHDRVYGIMKYAKFCK